MGVPVLTHDDTADELELGLAGDTLHTAGEAESTARVRIGDPVSDKERIAFAGVHGSFEAHHGCRGRVIIWEGEIRATDLGLWWIRDELTEFKLYDGTFTFTDDDGITDYENCVVDLIDLGHKKKLVGSSYDWWLPYRIVLFQLEV